MKAILLPLSLAAATATAGFALAEELSPAAQANKNQLAAHLGVSADDYTLLQLTQLNCRLEAAHSDAERDRLLEGIADFGKVPVEASTASKEQLATELGVKATDYDMNELAYLKSMLEDDDCSVSDPASWAKSGERLTFETAAAKQQLATALGVMPTEYTLAELIRMRVKAEDPSN